MDEARKPLVKSLFFKLLDFVNLTRKVCIYEHYRGVASCRDAGVSRVKILPAYDLVVSEPCSSVYIVYGNCFFLERGEVKLRKLF